MTSLASKRERNKNFSSYYHYQITLSDLLSFYDSNFGIQHIIFLIYFNLASLIFNPCFCHFFPRITNHLKLQSDLNIGSVYFQQILMVHMRKRERKGKIFQNKIMQLCICLSFVILPVDLTTLFNPIGASRNQSPPPLPTFPR